MKTLQILFLSGLAVFALACGYGSHSYMNPSPGNVPAIAQLSPPMMKAGSPAFSLTVNGSAFSGTAKVNFGGAVMTTTYISGNQLMASIPASAIATAATVQVTVTNPGTPGGPYGGGTQSETSAPMNFTVQ
ncbi:MAG TPA: IPT/TIG domain-containing protein [Candidatus Sulfotelmatobacter sp.]|nr:IPT/TIG domain-containing protein [Candidatus Sulfotelmatobacter sp.]